MGYNITVHANQTGNEQRPFHAIWLIQITPLDLLMWSHGQMKQSDSEYNAGLPIHTLRA